MTKFLRRTWNRYAKLGKGRKKKQVWRKPTGRDNKMRERKKGHGAVVSVGYKKGEKIRGLIQEKKPIIVHNVKDIEKIQKNEIVIIGNIGKKKKIEVVNKAKEMKIKINNLNTKKFLEKIKKEKEIQKEKKIKKEKKTKKQSQKVKEDKSK